MQQWPHRKAAVMLAIPWNDNLSEYAKDSQATGKLLEHFGVSQGLILLTVSTTFSIPPKLQRSCCLGVWGVPVGGQ